MKLLYKVCWALLYILGAAAFVVLLSRCDTGPVCDPCDLATRVAVLETGAVTEAPTATNTATNTPTHTPTRVPTATNTPTPTVTQIPTTNTLLSLRVLPEHSLIAGTGSITLTARLTDGDKPLPGRKIQFAYNEEWQLGMYAFTDSNGVASYVVSLANNPDSTGFCGKGGSRNTASSYLANARFQGDGQHEDAQTDTTFVVSSGQGTQTTISVSASGTSVTGKLQTVDGKALSGRSVRIRVASDVVNVQTASNGTFQATVDLTGAKLGVNTVEAIYQGDSIASAGADYHGCAASTFLVSLQARARPTPVPWLYWMYDWQNHDPNTTPGYGAYGTFAIIPWDKIGYDSNFEPLRDVLDIASKQIVTLPDGSKVPKPVIISVYFYGMGSGGQFMDYTPLSVKNQIGGSYGLAPAGCPPQVAPKYNNSIWQAAYKNLIVRLGQEFGNDPRLSAICVGIGFDGEAVFTKDVNGCPYTAELHKVCSDGEWQKLLSNAVIWHSEAFPNKPVYFQHFPQDVDAGYTLANPVNLKYQNWWPNSGGFAFKSNTESSGGNSVFLNRLGLGRAYESATGRWAMGGAPGTYWMFLSMLAHGSPDWVDIHSDHFDTFVENPGLSEWTRLHLGVNVHTTPSVWVAMRELQDVSRKEVSDCWLSGKYGDYTFYLYRLEVPGSKTVPVTKAQLPLLAQSQLYTNQLVTDKSGVSSPSYTARRTDKANGNEYMTFDIDNAWQYGPGALTLRLVYLDVGVDMFAIEYYTCDGVLSQDWVTRTGTGGWKETTMLLVGCWQDGFGVADLRIHGDVTIHMVELSREGR
jgi:hypothetical protein